MQKVTIIQRQWQQAATKQAQRYMAGTALQTQWWGIGTYCLHMSKTVIARSNMVTTGKMAINWLLVDLGTSMSGVNDSLSCVKSSSDNESHSAGVQG